VLNCDRGVKISGRGAGHFAEIVARARHVDALVAERATASNEQTQGIGQVHLAVVQMDTVTQANLAVTEKIATQADELNAHAAALTAVIGGWLALIGGARTNDPPGRPGGPRAGATSPRPGRPARGRG
jgi:methyl-accepting chemotaxis protein